MALIVSGVSELISAIKQVSGHSVKAVNDGLHDMALEIQKEAIANAPVEHGNLEHAIKVNNTGQRRGWEVYVDPDESDNTGKYTVGDYAMWLHESVYKLGKLSVEKQDSNGHTVGRKYLERAFNTVMSDQAQEILQDKLDQALKERYGR